MQKTYYTIYKITNQIDGKIYIGSHKTKNLNDNYMGSGKYLKYAQDKYGIENFEKEILFVFDTAQEMYAKEAELVNEEFIAENNTYNIKVGGFGGFDYINASGKNLYGKNGQYGYGGQNLNVMWTRSDMTESRKQEIIQKMAQTRKELYLRGMPAPFLGKHHSEQTLSKMRGHSRQVGNKNSQYGTMWINNGEINAKQPALEPLREGWSVGKIKQPKSNTTHIDAEQQEKQAQYILWHDLYVQLGFKEFVRHTGYAFSQANLVSRFKKYVPSFKPQNGKKRGT